MPWRDNSNPYRIWVSEIMLQQTQVKTVIPYYSRFLERFPDLKSLAGASENDVLELWSGLGYYRRARNLHRAAKLIVETHGQFPRDLAAISALPGVGRYTAGAICSLAFNQAQPIVDGNIRRVISRLLGLKKGGSERYFWDCMRAWISGKRPSDFNQAFMELGATVCMPAHPVCPRCPVEGLCEARRLGIQDTIPAARSSRATKKIHAVILVLKAGRKILLTSYQKLAVIPGDWGLPCCRVPRGKSPRQAAEVLCYRILGRTLPLLPCVKISHSITHHRITAYGFLGNGKAEDIRLRDTDGFRWATVPECGRSLTSSLFHKTLLKCGATGDK